MFDDTPGSFETSALAAVLRLGTYLAYQFWLAVVTWRLGLARSRDSQRAPVRSLPASTHQTGAWGPDDGLAGTSNGRAVQVAIDALGVSISAAHEGGSRFAFHRSSPERTFGVRETASWVETTALLRAGPLAVNDRVIWMRFPGASAKDLLKLVPFTVRLARALELEEQQLHDRLLSNLDNPGVWQHGAEARYAKTTVRALNEISGADPPPPLDWLVEWGTRLCLLGTDDTESLQREALRGIQESPESQESWRVTRLQARVYRALAERATGGVLAAFALHPGCPLVLKRTALEQLLQLPSEEARRAVQNAADAHLFPPEFGRHLTERLPAVILEDQIRLFFEIAFGGPQVPGLKASTCRALVTRAMLAECSTLAFDPITPPRLRRAAFERLLETTTGDEYRDLLDRSITAVSPVGLSRTLIERGLRFELTTLASHPEAHPPQRHRAITQLLDTPNFEIRRETLRQVLPAAVLPEPTRERAVDCLARHPSRSETAVIIQDAFWDSQGGLSNYEECLIRRVRTPSAKARPLAARLLGQVGTERALETLQTCADSTMVSRTLRVLCRAAARAIETRARNVEAQRRMTGGALSVAFPEPDEACLALAKETDGELSAIAGDDRIPDRADSLPTIKGEH